MEETILTAQNLKFRYDSDQPVYALDGVSTEVKRGEFVAVLGANGCGKSTLAKHFNAILLPESGKVYVEGMDTADDDKIYDIRQTVGMVFQNPDNQIVATVVEEDVAFALENLGVLPEEMRRRVSGIGRNVVIEITEEEDLDLEILNMKRRSTVLSGLYALDDYGSGYSNEGNLITLDPDFIKIDISIIRGIESDPDKQEVVRNIVSYAHQRGMQIVAEGIETAAELRTSRALGADLFQGYFLSRPGAVPSAIAVPAQEILREFPNGAEEHR